MNRQDFLNYISRVKWCFCKSVPNWPHFYIVEEKLPDHAAFHAAKDFVRKSGYVGKFFDMDVFYFDADGWTYWASPLAKPPESQHTLNRCKTEYTYESLAKSGGLPPEGFRESKLSLSPILEDAEFKSLVRDAEGREFTVFDVLGTSDYEIRHSNVLSWLLDRNGNHRQGSSFLDLLWQHIVGDCALPLLSFPDGIAPAKEEDSTNWRPISYSAVIQAVKQFLEKPLSERVKSFLEQYLEHIGKNVLKSVGSIERQRKILQRHAKIFHSLSNLLLLDEEYIRKECGEVGEVEVNLLKSILAVQKAVSQELFEFTKQMMARYDYSRHSGLGHWITIKLHGLGERLIQSGLAKPKEEPIIFALSSGPNSYVAEVWLYTKMPLFRKVKGQLPRFSEESPEPNRGDEHLVAVLYRKKIINADEIIKESLPELKTRIAAYFESDLESTLRELAAQIGNALDAFGRHDTHRQKHAGLPGQVASGDVTK